MKRLARRLQRTARDIAVVLGERVFVATMPSLNAALIFLLRWRAVPNSVLHISYMVHVPYHMVMHLRRHGIAADYLAIGTSPHWNKCDYNFCPSAVPLYRMVQEFWMFWRVVARYQVVHAHFMMTLTQSGWELPVLKRLGRRLIVHYRGCEVRDRARNISLHPTANICEHCDYNASICSNPIIHARRTAALRYSDVELVTTPDLRDFAPNAIHFPFFVPPDVADRAAECPRWPNRPWLKIVHATVHPGIEGTEQIEAAIERLRGRGWPLEFQFLRLVERRAILDALKDADLAVGKMKMGYYANFQIEAMALGVPTITYVRDEFMTDELRASGFIFSSLEKLEETLEWLLRNPHEIEARRQRARASILALHDEKRLVEALIGHYGWA
jgi:glycosyl transferase family 1